MKFTLFFMLCLALFCNTLNAEKPVSLKPLLFSYVSHPIVEQQLKPLITEAYRNLGYDIRFVSMQSDRFIKQFESGAVDGDVARLHQLTAFLPSMLLVYKFDSLNLTLQCRPGLSCTQADLDNPDHLLFIPAQTQVFRTLQLSFGAKVYTVRDWSQLIELYNKGKIDRFFWLEGTLLKSGRLPPTSSVDIKTPALELYHILHKSNAHLAPLISTELRRLMEKKTSVGVGKPSDLKMQNSASYSHLGTKS